MNLIAIAEVAAVYEALRRSSTVAQQVEDPLLSLLRLGLLLWQGFDSWPGNSPMPWCGQKKKKKFNIEMMSSYDDVYSPFSQKLLFVMIKKS